MDNYPDTFVLLQIHVYQTAWGDTRSVFYGQYGTPTAWFDGLEERVGAYSSVTLQYNDYRDNYFLPRQAVPTDVTITLSGEQIDGQDFEVQAIVCLEPGGLDTLVRLYLVQALDYWPPTPTYSRNGFKQAVDPEDIWLYPGQCQEVTRPISFDVESWNDPEKIKIIAWAQEPVDDAIARDAEVHQAAWMGWPFPLPSDLDSDGDVDLGDLATFVECLSGPGAVSPPPACAVETFVRSDLDSDGDVDLDDFAAFTVDCAGSG